MEQLAYPPRMTEFTRPFWTALGEGRFLTTRCAKCSHMTFPPKPLCPECWSKEVEWVPLKGEGILRSYTEICVAPEMFAKDAPYVLGIIDLDEGIRCMSRVLAPFESLEVDQRVKLRIRQSEPVCLYDFEP